jgi:broad specificity phosphatase PhoE
VRQGLNRILREQPGENKTVLVVAHGGILGVLLCDLMGMDLNHLWKWRIDTCSVSILDIYPEGAIMSLFNDVAHLDPAHLERHEPNPAAGQKDEG